MLFFSFAWQSLKGGVTREKEDMTVEKEVKEEEKEEKEGHFNVANTIDETDPVSKLSAEEDQGDSRGT